MRIYITICTLCFLFISTIAFAATSSVETESTITDVTVYRSYADIHRTTSVKIAAGSSEIVLENLSNAIDYRSLQVKIPSDVILLSASQRQNHLVVKKKTDNIILVEDSIKAIGMQMELLQNRIQTLYEEEQMILANKIVGGANSGLSSEELLKLSDFYRVRLLEIKDSRTSFNSRRNKKQEALSTYQNQLGELNRNLNKPTGEIVLQVRSEKARTIKVDFSYLVSSAYWSPSYDVRVEKVGQPIDLLYKANITQNTGIDWENVRLVINTGNPAIGLERPKLPIWYINFQTDGYLRQSRDKAVSSYESLNLAVERVEGNFDDEMSNVDRFVQVNDNPLNASFKIDLPYDIPSDNRVHLVAMKTDELKATYKHHTVPRLEEEAFLLAKVTEWEFLNLLPGPANVFLEGTYVGESQINPNIPSDTMLLSLGRDQKVIVDCKTIKEFTKTKVIGANKKQTFGYEVEIRNTKSVAISIEVLKNLPISQHDDIKVTIDDKSGARYTEKLGKLVWDLELAPGQTKTITLLYEVKYPKNKIVANL